MVDVRNFNIEEEIETIQAVYCQPGECQVTDVGSTKEITIQVNQTDQSIHRDITLTLSLPHTYPDSVPQVSLTSSQLSREVLGSVKKNVETLAQNLIGQQMVFDIISLVQENLSDIAQINLDQSKDSTEEDEKEKGFVWTAVLHLDHMRSKNRYIKTIEKWTSELGLTGRLIFKGRLILILLQGEQKDIKEYITRLRSVNIDVDSHGRSCKEKMMSVLCEERTLADKRLDVFLTIDCEKVDEVAAIFHKAGLENIYSSVVKDLQGKYF